MAKLVPGRDQEGSCPPTRDSANMIKSAALADLRRANAAPRPAAIIGISSLTACSGPLPGQRPSRVAKTKNCRRPWEGSPRQVALADGLRQLIFNTPSPEFQRRRFEQTAMGRPPRAKRGSGCLRGGETAVGVGLGAMLKPAELLSARIGTVRRNCIRLMRRWGSCDRS